MQDRFFIFHRCNLIALSLTVTVIEPDSAVDIVFSPKFRNVSTTSGCGCPYRLFLPAEKIVNSGRNVRNEWFSTGCPTTMMGCFQYEGTEISLPISSKESSFTRLPPYPLSIKKKVPMSSCTRLANYHCQHNYPVDGPT